MPNRIGWKPIPQEFCDSNCLADATSDDLTLPWMKRVNVVAEGNAEVFIEALLRGQKLCLIAEVLLTEHACFVVHGFQDFGDGNFIGVQSLPVSGKKHSEV